MSHQIFRVNSFDIVAAHTFRVRFDDNTEQTINFRPILAGELYGPLRDLELFNQVRVDPEVHTLVWPNAADFDPATLHDWPLHVGIDPIVALEGSLPNRAASMVIEWAALHQRELMRNWHRLRNDQPIERIEPLE